MLRVTLSILMYGKAACADLSAGSRDDDHFAVLEAVEHVVEVEELVDRDVARERSREREHLREQVRVADEGEAAVVRDVEPFVAVGGPGVGGLDAAGKVSKAMAGSGP